jgi:hypothetical protein
LPGGRIPERPQSGAVLINRRKTVSAVEIAPAQVVKLLELELNSAFDRVLFQRDRQVIRYSMLSLLLILGQQSEPPPLNESATLMASPTVFAFWSLRSR